MSGTKRRRLADRLIAEIRAGRYKPGDQLPSVRDLVKAEEGEATAIAALRLLVAEGWAHAVVGAGTFVVDPLPGVAPSLADRVAELERLAAEELAWRREHEQREH